MTSRLTLAAPAVRPALKARLMLAAPSGAGKTKTALIIAAVLAEDEGGKVIVIDTEKESALTYADDFDFIHLPWRPPYDPRELATTITEAGREHAVVVIDSTSHFWRKKGGTLDIAGGKFTGWADARPAQEDLVDAILGCNAHVILCARSKQEHVQEQDERGRHVVKKLGMAPQQDDDLEYEMNISCEMDMKHEIAVSKSRCDAVPVGRSFGAGHAGELAELYRDWLKVGEPPAPQAVVDALVARMNALAPELRKACKGEFVAELGRPELLREARLDAAEALVARYENGGGGPDVPPDEGSPTKPPPPDPAGGGEQGPPAAPAASEEVEVADLEQALLRAAGKSTTPQAKTAVLRVASGLGWQGTFDELVADPMGAAVLAEMGGTLPDAGPPDLTPWKERDEKAWDTWRKRCNAMAGPGTKAKPHPRLLDEDKAIYDEQRHALAFLASRKLRGVGAEVTSWGDVTEAEARVVERTLTLLAEGHGVLTFGDSGSPGGWEVQTKAEKAA